MKVAFNRRLSRPSPSPYGKTLPIDNSTRIKGTIKSNTTSKQSLTFLLAKEKREEKEEQDKRDIQRGLRVYHSIRPVTSLLKEGIRFAQLTRPSRLQYYYQFLPSIKSGINQDELLAFLVRPIKCRDLKDASPHTVTEAQVRYAFGTIGVFEGHIARLPGPIVEFMIVIHLSQVRRVPKDNDPLLITDEKLARKRFGRAIPPLLVELMDEQVTTPSHLIYINTADPIKEKSNHILTRNATHPNKDRRIITTILDNRFNAIPIKDSPEKKLKVSFEKSAHHSDRCSIDNLNTDFAMFDCWTNVVIDWERVYRIGAHKCWDDLPLGTLSVQDSVPRSGQTMEQIKTFLTYTCPEACFAESNICHDSTGRCRYLNWKNPSKYWTSKTAASPNYYR